MSQTVIGFFDDASEAQRAVERLQSSGISRDRIDVSGGNSGSSDRSSQESHDVNPVSGSSRDENSIRETSDHHTVDRESRNTNRFTDFFNNLFDGGDDKNSAKRYSMMAGQSNSIVTVHAQSKEEAESAADILDDCGAVDVDERTAQHGFGSGQDASGAGNSKGGAGRSRSFIVDGRIEDGNRLRDTM